MACDPKQKQKFCSEVRQYLVQCFDDLISQFPREKDLIMLKVFIENDLPAEFLTKMLHEHIYPLRQMIYRRDADFFLNRCTLFDNIGVDKTKVSHFKRMWQDPELTEEGKNIIWDWFELFAKYTEQYEGKFKGK